TFLQHNERLASRCSDKTQAIAIGILDIHFPVAPGLIRWLKINHDPSGNQFRIEGIYIRDQKVDHTARNAIPGKRRDMQQRSLARQAHIARVVPAEGTGSEASLEAQLIAVELLCFHRVGDMQDRYSLFECDVHRVSPCGVRYSRNRDSDATGTT